MSLKKAHESFSRNSRGPVHEDRRLHIEELDEWRTHKPRTPDKLKLRQNEPDTSPNQLKVDDKVLLDVADPHIDSTTPKRKSLLRYSVFFHSVRWRWVISSSALLRLLGKLHSFIIHMPLLCPSSCPYNVYDVVFTREEIHCPLFKEKEGSVIFCESNCENSSPSPTVPLRALGRTAPNTSGPTLNCGPMHQLATIEQVQMADAIRALLTTDPWELFFEIIEPTWLELTMELCSMFHLQTVMTRYDDPDTPLQGISSPTIPEVLTRLVHTIIERRESTGVINTHDVYFLWCMSQGHVIDLAYFIALAIQHQTERHRKGVISIGPYVTRLARHFGLLNTSAQESSFTLIHEDDREAPRNLPSPVSFRSIYRGMSQGHVIDLAYFIALAIQHQTERHRKGVISIGPYVTRLARHFGLLNTSAQESSFTLIVQMSPQGISSMLSMRMIERRRGTYPPQYHFAQSTEEEVYEDIPDDVPPQHEDPPTQPPLPSRPVHAAASYADISECLTQFEQQCFQRSDNIDATLQQICQHLHISSPVPPREPSSDEDV
ncbi:hypothetical protein GOBAR_AA18323 [Gossypium barbadense]|uniref:Uncharacterized protein n=1 Tax=Gossypium barbadense TaxID=3634 RepID=A0A2P5XG77_GOSBA|nr:hypothetical protein GOBAR_AA18323 [Gossypium barbadense]